MAKVSAKVIGGSLKEIEATTVGEVKEKLGVPSYTASVNGRPQDNDYALADYEFVSLAAPVKGGC